NCLFDLALMALDHRVIGAHAELARIFERGAGDRHILRDVDQHRSGTTARGDIKGLAHRHGEVAYVLHQEVVFDAGPGNPDRVALLERILADRMTRYLAADDH